MIGQAREGSREGARLSGDEGGELDEQLRARAPARDDLGRERLLEWVVAPGIDPYEMLFIAGRLVQLGPAAEVAERLKRVSHALPQGEVRTALQCLLWTWY